MKYFSVRLVLPLYLSATVVACTLGPLGQDGEPIKGTDLGEAVSTYKIGNPYKIAGIYYYPAEDYDYAETGVASWYGPKFHGRFTANGEHFDMNRVSAAHRTLPMPSVVRVTNLENGRSIALRVNDRGPFARGRIIDLSRRAAQLLGFADKGTARVRVRILAEESRRLALLAKRFKLKPEERILTRAAPSANVTVEALPGSTGAPPAGGRNGRYRRQIASVVPAAPPGPADPMLEFRAVRPTGLFVQAGSFVNYRNAARLRAKLGRFARARVAEAKIGRERFFRVRLGPLADVEAADKILDRVVAAGHPEARLIVD